MVFTSHKLFFSTVSLYSKRETQFYKYCRRACVESQIIFQVFIYILHPYQFDLSRLLTKDCMLMISYWRFSNILPLSRVFDMIAIFLIYFFVYLINKRHTDLDLAAFVQLEHLAQVAFSKLVLAALNT